MRKESKEEQRNNKHRQTLCRIWVGTSMTSKTKKESMDFGQFNA